MDAPEWNGLNCDSESSQLLETTIPEKSCDMRNVSGMFPPAFNELRKVLFEEHSDMWKVCGGMMIYNHDYLFDYLNNELKMHCTPILGMQECCTRWLLALKSRPKSYRSN
jgi:hypothetical protein